MATTARPHCSSSWASADSSSSGRCRSSSSSPTAAFGSSDSTTATSACRLGSSTPAPTRRQILAAIASKRYAKSAYTLADMADDTAGLLDAIGVEQAHVVGVSMGGMISQSLAIRHPRRVASLTSIMSNTGDRHHEARAPVTAAQGTRYMTLDPANRVENGMKMFG